jgi:hypothetical protein
MPHHRSFSRRLVATALCLISASAMAACGDSESSGNSTKLLDNMRQAGSAKIALAQLPPLEYLSPSGEPQGYLVDLTRGVLKDLGVGQIQHSITTFDGMIPALQARKFDFLPGGLNITAARCNVVVFTDPVPTEPTVAVLEHYARVRWIGAALDADINVRIRREGEEAATEGPAALAARVDTAAAELARVLEPMPDRPARIPLWGPWSLALPDMLITRMMEMVVHGDDLAVSVGVAPPRFTPSAMDTVIGLLCRLAVRRHGPIPILRAFSRAERAPDTVAAI